MADTKQKRDDRPPLDVEGWARKPLPKPDASPEDKADYVVSRFAVQDDHYRGLYRLWTKALLFLMGKHWNRWDERLGAYLPDTDVPAWRQQPVTNLTYAIYRTAVAKLTKQRPTLEVVPPSGDSEDRDSAQLGHAILEFLWRHLRTPQKMVRALGWFVATGNVFLNPDWDDEAGDVKPRTVLVEIADESNPDETIDVECACDEDGEPYRRKPAFEGETALDGGDPYDLEREPELEATGEQVLGVDDPFAVRFNPDAPSPEEAEEWYIGKLWPRQAAADKFRIPVEELGGDQDDAAALREEYDDVLSRSAAAAPDLVGAMGLEGGTDQSDAIGDRVLVIHYYRKPCPSQGYPYGRHFIVAGRRKVWPPEPGEPGNTNGEYPDGEAELPFHFWPPRVPLIDTPIPGQPQGLGMLTQVVPLNEQLNHLDGKISEKHVVDTMGGVWFVGPADRGIQITSEPGQVKVSREMGAKGQAGAPFQAKLNPLPEPVYREREVILTKLRMVAGVSELDLGQRPQGVSAGRAFLVIQEASDAAIMPALVAMESALEEVGRRQLVIAQQRYTDERTIKIRGEKGQWEFRQFKGADLRDGLDVRVQVGSSFPWSKSAQWDTKLSVLQALPQLMLNDQGQPDQQKIARYLDAGAAGLSAFTSDEDPDLVEIDREHAMFEAYNPDEGRLELPQIGFWQTHPKHQEHHYNFMKREQSRIARWHPAARDRFLEHVQQTTEAVVESVRQLMPDAPPAAPDGGGEEDAGLVAPSTEDPTGAGPMAGALRLGPGDRASAGA